MRLYELHGWDELRLPAAKNTEYVPAAEKLLSAIEKYGFKRLASGSKGIVFEHPGKPVVYKIFTEDMAYYNFLKFCLEQSDNPHLPKIKSKIIDLADIANRRDDNIDAEHMHPLMVKIERLTEISGNEFYSNRELNYFINKLFYKKLPDGMDQGKFEEINFKWLKENQKLAHTLIDLHTKFASSEYEFDFSHKSFMKRGDTLVIADPLT